MNIKRILYAGAAAAIIGMSGTEANAQSLIDAGTPDNLFTIGLRAGLNTSNINIDNEVFPEWNVNSWGTGFELGAVVNINLRNFFSLQPGFFYESRSGNYAYSGMEGLSPSNLDNSQMGHYRNYHFTVPVMAQLRMKLLPGAVWSVDVGPYFSWLLHSKHKNEIKYAEPGMGGAFIVRDAERNRYDWGLKVGTGINFLTHFYAGLHYKMGMRDVWNTQYLGGRSKVWTFDVGYDF